MHTWPIMSSKEFCREIAHCFDLSEELRSYFKSLRAFDLFSLFFSLFFSGRWQSRVLSEYDLVCLVSPVAVFLRVKCIAIST